MTQLYYDLNYIKQMDNPAYVELYNIITREYRNETSGGQENTIEFKFYNLSKKDYDTIKIIDTYKWYIIGDEEKESTENKILFNGIEVDYYTKLVYKNKEGEIRSVLYDEELEEFLKDNNIRYKKATAFELDEYGEILLNGF